MEPPSNGMRFIANDRFAFERGFLKSPLKRYPDYVDFYGFWNLWLASRGSPLFSRFLRSAQDIL